MLGERCRSGRATRCGPRGTGGRQVGGPAGGLVRLLARPRDPVQALAPSRQQVLRAVLELSPSSPGITRSLRRAKNGSDSFCSGILT